MGRVILLTMNTYASRMAHPRKYTEDQELAIAAKLIETGGNVKRTARELGIPRSTVRGRAAMAGLVEAGQVVNTIQAQHAELWERADRLVATELAERLPEMPRTPEGMDRVIAAARVIPQAYLDHRDGRRGTVQIGGDGSVVPVQIIIGSAEHV